MYQHTYLPTFYTVSRKEKKNLTVFLKGCSYAQRPLYYRQALQLIGGTCYALLHYLDELVGVLLGEVHHLGRELPHGRVELVRSLDKQDAPVSKKAQLLSHISQIDVTELSISSRYTMYLWLEKKAAKSRLLRPGFILFMATLSTLSAYTYICYIWSATQMFVNC